jgi:hypothetical protein
MLRALMILTAWCFFHLRSFAQHERICAQANTAEVKLSTVSPRENTTKQDVGQGIYIPVVVHVVYTNNTQNISDHQIYSQIKVLNEDYNRKNADSINTVLAFRPVAANSNISFVITEKDEFDNPVTGIKRVYTAHGPFANSDIHFTESGGSNAWDSQKYLNIWVCDLADGVFGFGSPPGTSPDIDGIVIDYKYFGTIGTVEFPYHKGRTATHEIGHWLGLRHLWGDTGGCTDDDGVEDTPSQSGASLGCDVTRISCGNLNMVQNYMDLSFDDCLNLFTNGQKEKMRFNLFEFRSMVINEEGIVTANNKKIEKKVEVTFEKNGVINLTGELTNPEFTMYDLLARPINFVLNKVGQVEYSIQYPESTGFFIIMIKTRSQTIIKKFHN